MPRPARRTSRQRARDLTRAAFSNQVGGEGFRHVADALCGGHVAGSAQQQQRHVDDEPLIDLEPPQQQQQPAASGISDSRPLSRLITLRLCENKLGDVGAARLASALTYATAPRLAEIAICFNEICEIGPLATALGNGCAPSLGLLRLGGNRIHDDGGVAVAESLRRLPKLSELSLGDDLGGNEARAQSSDSLQIPSRFPSDSPQTPSRVRQVGDGTSAALAAVIIGRGAPSLERLSLSNNRVGDMGAAALAEALRSDGAAGLRCAVSTRDEMHSR